MNQDSKIQILKEIVEIPTVNGNEGQLAQYFHDLFANYGIDSNIIEQSDGRSNLIAEIGNGQHPKIGLEGHEDTVHEGNINDWKTDPFKAVQKDGKIYGRGTTDMKAGLAAMAIAMIELKKSNIELNGTVRFIATISEELNEGGANYLAANDYVDDLDAIIVGEPTMNDDDQFDTFIAHKGGIIYTVESFGKAAHSSKPELGINAIDKLINFRIAEKSLFDSYRQHDEDLGDTVYAPDVIGGGKQVNSIPDYAYEKVMLRTIPQLPNDALISDLTNLVHRLNDEDPESNIKLTIDYSSYPVKTHPTKLLATLEKIGEKNLGYHIDTKAVAFGTDASQYTQANKDLKVIVLGPGNHTAHRTNEYVTISAYQQAIKLYYDIIVDTLTK